MAKLIYSTITSLDGYINDTSGRFDWAAPDEQVHAYVNDQERAVGTYLYGRRMYETMHVWQHPEEFAGDDPITNDYAAIWQGADKIVFSSTLDAVTTPRTRLERTFDPDAIRTLKASIDHDISIGGAGLAARAMAAGLVDEINHYLNPVIVGGGTRALPDGVRLDLELVDEHRFANGVVHVRHRLRA
ncbi:MAG: Bifunctional deaminase-reductase [Ilumatobacteraceae bacterium]|nr:Bifunctional deaminase-reductase [Ilumatobacteraceae bacterium]